jgi:purine-cytosine permease-like protein
MDKLKTYAIPLLGLLVFLAYWFVVRPMLAEDTSSSSKASSSSSK